jgi:hypothetical protein
LYQVGWKNLALFVFLAKDRVSGKTKCANVRSAFSMCGNVISLGEVADFGKINFQLKNKYDAKRERE